MKVQTVKFKSYNDVLKALEAAGKQRQEWEAGAYAASNEKLYALLGACYDVYLACIRTPELADGLTKAMQNLKMITNKGTSLALKITRFVFANQDNLKKSEFRVLSYARVLDVAHEEGCAAGQLAAFIKERGGIDEIRRNGGEPQKKSKEPEQMVTVAKRNLGDVNTDGLFDKFTLPAALKPIKGSRFSLALIRDNGDGTGTIVRGIQSANLVEGALAEAGRELTKQVEKSARDALVHGNDDYALSINKAADQMVSDLVDAATGSTQVNVSV